MPKYTFFFIFFSVVFCYRILFAVVCPLYIYMYKIAGIRKFLFCVSDSVSVSVLLLVSH